MKLPKTALLSYTTAALIGFCLALVFGRGDGGAPGEPELAGAEAGEMRRGASKLARGANPQNTRMNSSQRSRFRAAWNALPDQKLSKRERLETQRRMLAEWAKIDLAGAMDAALTVPWDDSSSLSGPVASVFADAFRANPEESWDLIQSGGFGLGSAFFRNVWINNVCQSNPLLVAEVMPEGSWRDRERMITQLQKLGASDPGVRAALVDALRAQPDDVVTAAHLQKLLPPPSLEEMQERAAGMDDFSGREGQLLILQLMKSRSEEIKEQRDPAELTALVSETMAILPHEAQGRFLYQIMGRSLASEDGETGGRQAMALVDLLVDGEHWDYLDDAFTKRRVSRAAAVPPDERAAWAVTLPELDEANTLFHQSVKDYVSKKPAEAWQWIEGLPQGRWRDHAYGEFSLRAINNRKDYEASRRALDQIVDLEYRSYMEQRRPDWAKEMDKE